MSKRLQVVLDDSELDEIRSSARRERLTVSEWVRQTLRTAREERPRRARRDKLDAIQQAALFDFPTGGIDQILDEIARGRSVEGPG